MAAPAWRRNHDVPRRVAIVMSVLIVVGMVVAVVAGRLADPEGAGRVLYRLHDDLWLPVVATIWTAPFPYALIWAVPLSVALAIAATEYLTPFGLWGAHRRAGLLLLRRGGNDPLLDRPPLPDLARRWDVGNAVQVAGREGYLRRLAAEDWTRAWAEIRAAHLEERAPDAGTMRRAARMAGHWLRRDPAGPAPLMAVCQVAALLPGRDRSRLLEPVLAALTDDGLAGLHGIGTVCAVLRLTIDGGTPVALAADLLAAPGSAPAPVALAVCAVFVAAAARDGRGRVWFDAVEDLRFGTETQAIAAGTRLIDWDFWAALAERADPRPPDGLMPPAWTAVTRGEAFAQGRVP